MIFFLLIILIFMGLINFINGISILKLVTFYIDLNVFSFWGVYIIICLVIFFLILIPHKQTQKLIGAIFGFIVYYCLINILFMLLPINSTESIEIIKLAFTFIISIIGIINVHRIKITNYNITTNKNIKDLNIVMFADLHLGILINHIELSKIVKEINKIKPDLLLIPGDFFNGNIKDSKELNKISIELNKIKTKYGIYLSPGNHDLFVQNEELRSFLKSSNITLLDDECIATDNITIIGRKDVGPIDTFRSDYKRKTIKELLEKNDNNNLIIILDHQPSDLLEAANNNVDLTLSGHTHKGQIFPGNIITKLMFTNSYGYKKINNTDTIVTSGVGYWQIPLRLGSNSEIVNIKISNKNIKF